ncbi:MAG: hypothetical protein GX815_10585, partial [Clostridiales bacterium]|nr:hypothetical protein [Clostridiales bacterium]
FTSADYFNIVSDEEIRQSRVWLGAAVASASTEKQKARAELILKQFEYYEASALSYPKKVDAPTNAEDALLLLEESVNYQSKLDYAKKRFEILDSFEDDPILRHGSKLSTSWSGLNPDAFGRLLIM